MPKRQPAQSTSIEPIIYLRDSHMTGVRYGLYDLDWLLQALTVRVRRMAAGSWRCEGRKGLPPAESFFLGRHFMYQQVYHHKATRAAEALVRAIFLRVSELIFRRQSPPDPLPSRISCRGSRRVAFARTSIFEWTTPSCSPVSAAWERRNRLDPGRASANAFAARQSFRRPFLCRRTNPRQCCRTTRSTRAKGIVEAAGGHPAPTCRFGSISPKTSPTSEPTDGQPRWACGSRFDISRCNASVMLRFLLGQLRNKRIQRPRV